MSMSVGPPSGSEEPGVMANINTTPLVDVMLVLLIIFLITIPVINKTVKVDLPKAVNIPTQTKPENITVAVDKNGNIYWNDKSMPTRDDLLAYVKAAADKDSRYEAVGRVLYALQRGGIVKVGFLTEPDHGVRGVRQ
jgi:biopolymer transport protein ExbD